MIKTTITILLCTLAFIVEALRKLIDLGVKYTSMGSRQLLRFENYLIRTINERRSIAEIIPATAAV